MSKGRKQARAVRFEASDVPPLLPLWLGAGLGGAVIGVMLAITLFYPLATSQEYRGPLQHLPQAPTLEVAPEAHLAQYDAAKWRELQRAPMPIEQAMRATAEQGWGSPK
jgi:hypothetical protein